jgi:hypothetical protein
MSAWFFLRHALHESRPGMILPPGWGPPNIDLYAPFGLHGNASARSGHCAGDGLPHGPIVPAPIPHPPHKHRPSQSRSRDSSVGRASDWRSEGPRLDPEPRHLSAVSMPAATRAGAAESFFRGGQQAGRVQASSLWFPAPASAGLWGPPGRVWGPLGAVGALWELLGTSYDRKAIASCHAFPKPPWRLSFQWGTWCSGITSASHAEGPWFKSQCVHVLESLRPVARRKDNWPRGVTASTLDSESSDRGSHPREAFPDREKYGRPHLPAYGVGSTRH